jgi:hypothetical protein
MAVWVSAGWRWMLRNIWCFIWQILVAGEFSALSCHLTCGSQRICMWCEEAIKSVWSTVLTHNEKVFSWFFVFVLSWTIICACRHEICFCLKEVIYSSTTVRCVLMSPCYVCSVYIGVGITLHKSSVYHTQQRIFVYLLFGNSWLTYFLSFMGFLS